MLSSQDLFSLVKARIAQDPYQTFTRYAPFELGTESERYGVSADFFDHELPAFLQAENLAARLTDNYLAFGRGRQPGQPAAQGPGKPLTILLAGHKQAHHPQVLQMAGTTWIDELTPFPLPAYVLVLVCDLNFNNSVAGNTNADSVGWLELSKRTNMEFSRLFAGFSTMPTLENPVVCAVVDTFTQAPLDEEIRMMKAVPYSTAFDFDSGTLTLTRENGWYLLEPEMLESGVALTDATLRGQLFDGYGTYLVNCPDTTHLSGNLAFSFDALTGVHHSFRGATACRIPLGALESKGEFSFQAADEREAPLETVVTCLNCKHNYAAYRADRQNRAAVTQP